MNYQIRPHRSECMALPKGWIREEYPRHSSGINSGGSGGGRKSDVYYVSPSGKRVRSKPELIKVLGGSDLSAFDYQTGRINPHLIGRNHHHHHHSNSVVNKSNSSAAAAAAGLSGNSSGNVKSVASNAAGSGSGGKNMNGRGGGGNNAGSGSGSGNYDFARGIRTDATLVPPIRQTASIFKQPVTVRRTMRGCVIWIPIDLFFKRHEMIQSIVILLKKKRFGRFHYFFFFSLIRNMRPSFVTWKRLKSRSSRSLAEFHRCQRLHCLRNITLIIIGIGRTMQSAKFRQIATQPRF